MKTTYRQVLTQFGPETQFDVPLGAAAPFRAVVQDRFDQLQRQMLAARLEMLWEPRLNSPVRRAANEAAALAWLTPYPLLVFPVLFEEKADLAVRQDARQEQVRQRSRELLGV